jgi:hypothetical protein
MMQGTPTEGSFLKTTGSTMFLPPSPNNTEGFLEGLSDILLINAGASGSGTLATMTFSILKSGSCQISLNETEFDSPPSSNGESAIIPVTITNATFTTLSDSPSPTTNTSTHGPTANFSPADESYFQTGTSITLNASSSQPGYDTENCPITDYSWSIEYLNGTTLSSLSGENATFNATTAGTFRIILIVTAVDVHSPMNPSYSTTDSTSAIINVVSNTPSVDINVFTDNTGADSGASTPAYGPLQLVQMYALVTVNNASTPDQNVLFYIQNSIESVIAVRQGNTNETGTATANFTLPTPDPNSPQNSFGNWYITASVDIMGSTINDTANFTFNYQSGIENIQIPASIQRSETLPIQLTVNNAYLSGQWTKLSITIFDQAGIPIGSATITADQQTQNITIIAATITIPSWAFTGQATAYFCLLSASSNTQDVPIAPETVAQFQILN